MLKKELSGIIFSLHYNIWLGVNCYLKFIVFNVLNLKLVQTVSMNLLVRVTGSKLVFQLKLQVDIVSFNVYPIILELLEFYDEIFITEFI